MSDPDYVYPRGKRLVYRRRVPVEYAAYDLREYVEVGLGTQHRGTAIRRADDVNKKTELYWEELRKHSSKEAKEKYEAAIQTARRLKLEYKPVASLADGEVVDILKRLKIVEDNPSDSNLVTSVLGLTKTPNILLSEAPELFFEHSKAELKHKSPEQE